jgi:hypothetical protein
MSVPFQSGDTILSPGIGICLVERVLPSGAMLVRDCLGQLWLAAADRERTEKVPATLCRKLRRKEKEVEKRVGSTGQGRGKR